MTEAVRERRAARHKWQRSRAPVDKTRFNQLSKKVKALISEVDNKTFGSKLLSLDATKETDYALWKIARKKLPKYAPPIRAPSGDWTRSDTEKANTFSSHLEKAFQPNDISSDIKPTTLKMDGPVIKS